MKKKSHLFPVDITAIAKVYGKEVQREGISYMEIEKLAVDFTMKNARFKVKDNVNSANVLGMVARVLDISIVIFC